MYENKNNILELKARIYLFLNKELSILEFEIKRIEVKLNNINFIEKAPKKVVEENKKKLNSFYNSKK